MKKRKWKFDRVKKTRNCNGGVTYTVSTPTPSSSSLSTPEVTDSVTSYSNSPSPPFLCNAENYPYMKKGRTVKRDIGGGLSISIDCMDGCVEIVKV